VCLTTVLYQVVITAFFATGGEWWICTLLSLSWCSYFLFSWSERRRESPVSVHSTLLRAHSTWLIVSALILTLYIDGFIAVLWPPAAVITLVVPPALGFIGYYQYRNLRYGFEPVRGDGGGEGITPPW
jgi:hypothetical protein